MPILNKLVSVANRMLSPFDAQVVKRTEFGYLQGLCKPLQCNLEPTSLPAGAAEYLDPNCPRLAELRESYRASVPSALAASRWTEEYKQKTIDLRFFRGYNSYVFSDTNWEFKYALSAYYAYSIDRLGLLEKLEEDHFFGCPTIALGNGRIVSRDLLSSVIELNFLERTVGLGSRKDLSILDVGAGYGRLAHRAVRGLTSLRNYLCTDVIAESTFLSEYYLQFRNVGAVARAIPFDELESVLKRSRVDLAVNIHSFSECTLDAIKWWASTLKRNNVSYLMIAPNAGDHGGRELLSQEVGSRHLDFLPILTSNGYHRVEMQPMYGDPLVQEYGISPTYYHLFELR